mgnify:CR=1 FL=1
METIDFQGQTLRKWTIGHATYLACPERGARLMNWNVQMADGSVRDVIHWPEDPDYTRFEKIRGGNPILFPFCGRSFDNGDLGRWKDPSGRRLPMPMHGIARQGTFELVDASASGFTAKLLIDTDEQFAPYPFHYDFLVTYHFEELALTVDLTLRNRDSQRLPWSAGHHFYFSLPWHDEASRAGYRIDIPAKKAFRHAPDGSLEAVKKFTPETRFDDPELGDRIHCRLKKNEVVFGPLNGEEDITLSINPGADTPVGPWTSIVTWTENESSPFYCVEPWMSPPNSPANDTGVHYVEPGASETFSVRVRLY